MRRTLSLVTAFILLAGMVPVALFAAEPSAPTNPLTRSTKISEWAEEEGESPPGELMIFDALILRPAGVVGMGVGLTGAFVAMPWAATSNSGKKAAGELLRKPFDYTFTRPLGEFD